MIYRTCDRAERDFSLLGFGAMRLPLQEDGTVDEAQAVRMIRRAVDSGINYIDTAYVYHGDQSEIILGRALKDGYRDRVFLADKLPIWLVQSEVDTLKYFNEQLRRLDTDTIDLYLVHSLDAAEWETTKKYHVLETLAKLKEEGLIRYLGFSYHDELPLFKEIIDAFDWDFCQIQLNYTDAEFQAGLEGLRFAASKGIGVIVMEPLKGGRLVNLVPPAIQSLWDSAPVKRSPVEWAFKWVAAQPGVSVMLSGMSSMEQLEQNLEIFSKEDLTELTAEENALVEQVAAVYRKSIKYPCTECRYCMPCPSGVSIPRCIRYYNDWLVYEHDPSLKNEYLTWLDPPEHASSCVRCGQCEERCPQHLPVMQIMEEIAEAFGL